MNVKNIEDIYALSPMQQGMLFHSLYAPETGVYFEQSSWTLRGDLDVPAFERAWQLMLDRHSALRTSFLWEDLDEPLQVVHRQLALPFERLDWRDVPVERQQMQLDALLAAQRQRGFDLSEAPLMHLVLIRIAADAYWLVWNHHHLLLDGWSQPILFGEVFTAYGALQTESSVSLPPVRPYRDYIAWLQKQDMDKAETFWRQALQGFTAPTPLTVDRALTGATEEAEYASQRDKLSRETTQDLRSLAREHQLTLNTVVQGAWALLLSRYSGEKDIVFGATLSGRPGELPGADSMVGLFINTLPVRVRVHPDHPLISWLQDLQAQQAALRQYEYTPLVEIQGWTEVPRDTPLFESLLVFESYPVSEIAEKRDSDFAIETGSSFTRTNYPLTAAVSPGQEIGLELFYDARRFDTETIHRMLGHLRTLLVAMTEQPVQRVASLSILTADERRLLVEEWNHVGADYPDDQCLHELFEAHAAGSPAATAVVCGENSLTYAELNDQANRVAHRLRALGVEEETRVGIYTKRSVEMIVGLLGILKAGGVYVPLDPDHPDARLALIQGDADLNLILTTPDLRSAWPIQEDRVRLVDVHAASQSTTGESGTLPEVSPEQLAYVLYTSGSTGRPKGVMVEHQSVVALLYGYEQLAPSSASLVGTAVTPFGFDVSVWEFFSALCFGGTLHVLRSETVAMPESFARYLVDHQVSSVYIPPALLEDVAGHLEQAESQIPLQRILVGVEPIKQSTLQRFRNLSEQMAIINGYGPTETTICATFHDFEQATDPERRTPIGYAVPNYDVHIVGESQQVEPVGVIGEILIGGPGLARGYLNDPGLTGQKFVPHPLSQSQGKRVYRTGDLARRLPGGSIEFVGRVDHQVKIRGFRVEPGEIENILAQHPSVDKVIVLAREDEGAASDSVVKHLVAYVVRDADAETNTDELRTYARAQLPAHMVPTAFVTLETLPLTPNGKIDRKALPAPDRTRPVLERGYVAPRTPVEEDLADIWGQVLKVDRVGVHDNFFDLGGHSLLATQLISRAREVFEVEMSLPDLFEMPTVAGLAERIEKDLRSAAGIEMPSIEPASREGGLPLSFAQQRLWFLDQLSPGNLFYNIPLAVHLEGELDVEALKRTLNEVVQRHEVLRTTFDSVDGKPVQLVAPELEIPVPVEELVQLTETEQEAAVRRLAKDEAQELFDLTTGPLLRARLLCLGEEEHVLLLTMHHIISDGWSMGVFLREVAQTYTAFEAGDPSPLPELPIQYADFARWQREWLQGEVLETQLSYWKDQLGDSPPMLELPTDHPRPAVQTSRGATQSLTIPRQLAQALKALGREEGATLFMTLLTAYQTLLYRYTGQRDISVGTPIANRNRPEVEDLIGFFVNTLVMRTDLSGDPTFRELLRRVREKAVEAYAYQDLPFETLVEGLRPERDLSHTPLFQTMFILDTPAVEHLQLPNLTLSPIETHSGAATFDLTLSITDLPEGLGGYVEYNTDLFERETIERMIGHLRTLLEAIVVNPDQRIAELPLLTEAERDLMLFEWNATAREFPREQCIHQLFEAKAETQPGAPALVFEGSTLTYADLNRRANQLAHHLQKSGVGPETLVAVSTLRSPEMVVGVLGALKAGGAYLPLDPTYPEERLAFMLEDSQAAVLLTQRHLREHVSRFAPPTIHTIVLDTAWDTIAGEPEHNPESDVTPDNLAYVIYTSGSTGRPKGTMLRHRGLCNLTDVQRRAFGIRGEGGSRILQFSPLSFDASVWETFMALRNGATLCLARQETLASGRDLVQLMADEEVTNATLPPSVLSVLPKEALPDLETVISAGEACTAELVARWAPGRQFVNAYGPTETTVCASMHVCDENDPDSPPIGHPIDNTQLYVLDQTLQPVPIGTPGELVVGGVSLARGYLGRPELTAESFIPDSFSGERGARLYRTGDLVRYRPGGTVEYLGRIDHQVKVRGFRIELGEIESVLDRHAHVQDSVVVAREDVPGDRRIVAYLVPGEAVSSEIEKEADLTPGALRSFLRETLPEYMVPSAFVTLEGLPLSPSGKVDRDALPAPDRSRPEIERVYVAPRNETEETLARLCSELLRVEKVGVYDGFFELGGHSLLATQLVSRVRDAFQVELPLRTLFEHPTVAELAEAVEEAMQHGAEIQAPTIRRASRDARRVKRAAFEGNDGRSRD
jgi:amino acid adenylation domain-containing protein